MKKNKKPIHGVPAPIVKSAVPLTKSKKILFRIIMVFLPFIVLFMAEAVLRIFNYGGNTDLFVYGKSGNHSEYVLNKNFTKRYFFQKGISTPLPLSQTFSAVKDKHTYRIFCLGESSVQGFPYTPNAAFPADLKNILSTLHTDKNIEVVNCGITAIMSFSVLDMSEEILDKYQPNLLVIYTGHNEFYGVFGQASRLSLFENPSFLRLFLKLQHTKLFLLTRDVVNSIFGKNISDESSVHRGTLMANVARNAGILLNDDIVKKTEDTYRQNIELIVEKSREHKTDIIICNLVSNLKDFYPFASMHRAGFSAVDSSKWEGLEKKIHELQSKNLFKEAANLYLQLLKIDPSYAGVQFKAAQCFYKMQDYESARKHFQLARDLDVIRFRAPSSFNLILEEICGKYKVPLVDLYADLSSIAAGTPYGIIGKELLTEHVHPNEYGYLQIAKSVAKTMSKYGLVSKSWDWSKNISDSAYLSMNNLTDLDREIAQYTLFRLTSFWPFNENHRQNFYERTGNARTEQLARMFVDDNKGSEAQLHLKYGIELEDSSRDDMAIAEYKAALAIQPDPGVFNRIGRLFLKKAEISYRHLNDFNNAMYFFNNSYYYFTEGLKYWPDNIELIYNLSLLDLMRKDKLNESEILLQKVLMLNPSHNGALQQLSDLFMHLNQLENAKNILKKAIEYYPGQAGFYTNYGIVLVQQHQIAEAKTYFQKAIEISNDQKAKYYMSKLNAL